MLVSHLVVLAILQGSPLQDRPAPARDYAIYNVVLDSLPSNTNRRDVLVIRRTVTRDASFRRTVLRLTPRVNPDSALVDSLANGPDAFTPHVLDSAALAGTRFITDSVFQSFFPRDPDAGWAAFRQRYSGAEGVVQLSNVAYHPNGNLAVVYVALRCGSLCGWGGLYFLALAGDKWTITRKQMEWVS